MKSKDIAPKLKLILDALPNKPGVYQYFNEEGKIIYVGKAKSLAKRVRSYFTKLQYDSGKTRLLVKRIKDIKYIVVETEFDALFLENSLIKKHQPKFNVQLRDDKSYPWICIKNERFPRVFSTRNIVKDGSEYFGPYGSVKVLNALLNLITNLYQLRTCNYQLSKENIDKGKFRVCLEYQIGNCKGPCEGKQTEENYMIAIDHIKAIIKGDTAVVIKYLYKELEKNVADYHFEQAHFIKKQIDLLERYQAKSTIVNPSIHNTDVFSIVTDEQYGYLNYMKINSGVIIQSHTIELKKRLDETKEDLLAIGIAEMRTRFASTSNTIYLPFKMDLEIPNVSLHIPMRGDKKKLMDLSERNVKYFILEKRKKEEKVDPERHTKRILEQLKTDLKLTELPRHIECFDNSNFQGTEPVAACVVFRNAKPYKKDYRHFNIKTVEGPDDFASMEEVIYRRYKRLLDENTPLPQLIVIDGGKGQLSAAVKSLDKLDLRGKIAIIGIAKKLEEIYFPGDSIPVYIDKRSESLKVIQHLRNEAHRFGITHHRNRRSKATIKSELTSIKGIGDVVAKQLLKHFKSVKRIKISSKEELAAVIGVSKATLVFNHFST